VKITCYGHAFFVLEGERGPTLAIDPFDASVGYRVPSVTADIVLASHGHFDHANVDAIGGDPTVLVGAEGLGRHELKGAVVTGVPSKHYDDPASAARGDNTIYVIELDGLRVCHAGDLGHVLGKDAAAAIGAVDLLMVPVGGFFTIDARKADAVVDRLAPRIVIPMHYRVPGIMDEGKFPIATKDRFLRGKPRVREKGSTATVTSTDLPAEREIWVMAHVE